MSRRTPTAPDPNSPLPGSPGAADPDDFLRAAPELAARLSAMQDASTPSPDTTALRHRLAAAVECERGVAAWLRSRPTGTRMFLPLGFVLLVVVYQFVFSRRADLAVYPSELFLLAMAAAGAVIGLGVVVELWPLHRRPLRPLLGRASVALALLVPFVLAMGPVHTAHPASLEGTGADFIPRAGACFLYGSVFGAPFVALLWALDRSAQARPATALLAALLAGVAANLALLVHCAITAPAHLALGHATVGAALALAYATIRVARNRLRAPKNE